jgi:hypothetical protein
MHVHVKIHHWVMWWFYLGVICGVVALINIFFRDLTPTQVKLVLVFGVLHWVLGGVVIYCCDGVKIETPAGPPTKASLPDASLQTEWHSASDFIHPGSRKSLLPPKY